jgi:uncharacterized protein YukE
VPILDAVDPEWVTTIPTMFHSAAQSIERHRRRLIGNPEALLRVAQEWRTQAGQLDQAWISLEESRHRSISDWQGDASDRCSQRCTAVTGQVSADATSLRFAADGLTLAAQALHGALRRADSHVRRYITGVRLMNAVAQRAPLRYRASSLNHLIQRGDEFGSQTLRAVYGEEVRLDAVLSSMPRRFVVGPSAPWREGIQFITDRSMNNAFGGSLTVSGIRIAHSEGMVISRSAGGGVVITLTDGYGLGLHESFGGKLSADSLPQGVKEALKRAYGEVEIAGITGYALRYRFSSVTQAQKFIDHLESGYGWNGAAAKVVGTGGFLTGSVVGASALEAKLAGRDPDEVTVSVGSLVRANGDFGVTAMAAGQGSAGGDATGTLTLRKNGEYSISVQVGGAGKVGETVAGHTRNVGSACNVIGKVDYDASGQPNRLTLQTNRIGDYEYHGGTNNSYAGVSATPLKPLPKGGHLKLDAEGSFRELDSYSLDLKNPKNREVFQKSPLGIPQQIQEHGVLTVQRYIVERRSGEASATAGLGPETYGLKFGVHSEEQNLVGSSYQDLGSFAGHTASDPHFSRPIPQDPRTPVAGPYDVPSAEVKGPPQGQLSA